MAFKLGNLLILVCSLTTVSVFSTPEPDWLRSGSNLIDKTCGAQNIFDAIGSFWSSFTILKLLNRSPGNVYFQLRSPCNRTAFDISEVKNLVTAPGFDVNKPTVVFVNGWMTDLQDDNTESLTKSYLCRNTENFIVVDPSRYLRTKYEKSAKNTGELGKLVARGLINLGIPGKNIHLIGHSLGAHVMGMAARTFAAETNDKIGRVTGLDPARPCFINTPVFDRLTSTDATFVDVIHTNPTELGTEEAIGQVDFYPGGLKTEQGDCGINALCSHRMSNVYYIDTVYPGNEQNYMASKCDSYSQLKEGECAGAKATMGYAADPTARGIYFLAVNATTRSEKVNPQKCGICTA